MNQKDIDPQFLYEMLANNDVATIRKKFSLECNNEWEKLALKIFNHHKSQSEPLQGMQLKISKLNKELQPYALIVPGYFTRPEFCNLKQLLELGDIESIKKEITSVVMNHEIRAIHHNDKFCKLDIFIEFSEFIHSSLVNYYQCNFKSAYLSLLPVIEGVLLRWQLKFSGTSKSDFKKAKKFISKSIAREPRIFDPYFSEIYIDSVNTIIAEHLYLDTRNENTAFDSFNRHTALHMLDSANFATKENVARLFLILDLLSLIYTNECRITDEAYLFRPYNTSEENSDINIWIKSYLEAEKYEYSYI